MKLDMWSDNCFDSLRWDDWWKKGMSCNDRKLPGCGNAGGQSEETDL